MYHFSVTQFRLLILVLGLGFTLTLGGCDFGAAQQAVDSMGVIVKLEPIETTVSGQIVDAATGELVETPVTLQFKGPDGNAPVDMYTDPISSQEVAGGLTSFGIRNSRRPSAQNPVRLRVVANAEGYQSTSEQIEIHDTGTKQFTLNLLSENPKQQPEGASGIRDKSGQATETGKTETDLNVETPAKSGEGRAALHVSEGSVLRGKHAAVSGNLTVDLSHYHPNDATLEALPGNGTVDTGTDTEKFQVVGYLNLQIQGSNDGSVSTITSKGNGVRPQTAVRLSADAAHPSTGRPLESGDELELFQYNRDTGTWRADTTVTIRALDDRKDSDNGDSVSGENVGFHWNPWRAGAARWWAWGARSRSSCEVEAGAQIDPNGQSGSIELTLRRSGLKYSNSIPSSKLAGETPPLSSLISQSEVPQYSDYTLQLTTREGKTQTVENIDPCGGTYSATLPAPASTTQRTDVLFRAHPECPADQKVRITSVPTVTIYYRETNARDGSTWHTAGDDKISWVMDDPDNPTYIKWAELRIDGLKQETRYQMYTTYDGERYEGSAVVPSRDTATIEEDRVLVNYSQDFSDVCS